MRACTCACAQTRAPALFISSRFVRAGGVQASPGPPPPPPPSLPPSTNYIDGFDERATDMREKYAETEKPGSGGVVSWGIRERGRGVALGESESGFEGARNGEAVAIEKLILARHKVFTDSSQFSTAAAGLITDRAPNGTRSAPGRAILRGDTRALPARRLSSGRPRLSETPTDLSDRARCAASGILLP